MNHGSWSALLLAHVPGLAADMGSFDPDAVTADGAGDASPEAAPENRPSPSGPRRRPWQRLARRCGRPSLLTEDLADRMYGEILESGLSDSKAAVRVNVSPSAVSQWKREDPNFAEFLESARAKYEFAQIRTVRDTRGRDGRDDVRNAKWLLKYSNPEAYGGRPRKRSAAPCVAAVERSEAPNKSAQTPTPNRVTTRKTLQKLTVR